MQNPTVLPSEKAFSPETVCVPVTGVYIARALNPAVPGTKPEVLSLALQMGTPYGVGANYTKLAPAMKARYGLDGVVVDHVGAAATYAAVMAAAAAGPCVVGLSGDQFNLSPRYQSNHVVHSIAVLYANGTTGIQLDPLAPAGYTGDLFPPAELAKFATAAIIFKAPKEEDSMASFKPGGPFIGKFTIGAGHSLISTANTKQHYPTWPGGSYVLNVVGAMNLVSAQGVPIDIEGNSPPLNSRDQVYLVDLPGFGASAMALRQDGVFAPTPPPISPADLAAARSAGIKAAADAAAATK